MSVVRRAAAAAITTLAVGAALVPADAAPTPAGRERAAVRLTIDDGASGGRIASSRAACERGVGVTVLSRDSGSLLFFGEATSNRQGRWQTRRRVIPSTAFAVAPGETGCAPAQSATTPLLRESARRAPVRITLRAGGASPRGRVVSRVASCERGVDVTLFSRSGREGDWRFATSATTDGKGRYDFGPPRRLGGGVDQLTAVALASRGCRIAQSGTVPFGVG